MALLIDNRPEGHDGAIASDLVKAMTAVDLEMGHSAEVDAVFDLAQARHQNVVRAKLAARGEAEAAAMREILESQRKHIESEAKRVEKLDPKQRLLDFGDDADEIAQLKANQRYWTKRLGEIREELKTEPDRVRDVYAVKARRIEPVGLVYLWPVTN